MRLMALLLMLAVGLTVCARAEELDYKALYLKANDSAAQWKARAEALERELSACRANHAAAAAAVTAPAYVPSPPTPSSSSGTITTDPHTSAGSIWVNGYTRKDGTVVRGYWRSR